MEADFGLIPREWKGVIVRDKDVCQEGIVILEPHLQVISRRMKLDRLSGKEVYIILINRIWEKFEKNEKSENGSEELKNESRVKQAVNSFETMMGNNEQRKKKYEVKRRVKLRAEKFEKSEKEKQEKHRSEKRLRNENGRTKFVKKVEKSEVQGEILKPRLSSYKERGAKSFSQSSQEKIENESGSMSTHEKVIGKVRMSRHNGEEIEKMGQKSQNVQNSA